MSLETQARDLRMVQMHRSGLTLQQIGDKFGVSRERVRQVMAKAGATGARKVIVKKAKAQREASRAIEADKDSVAKYGFPVAEMRSLRANGAFKAYQHQLHTANVRGIKFEMLFSEWVSVWKASGKFSERGRGKGKYCMARLNDEGGYVVGNVHIDLNENNNREGRKRGKRRPPHKRGVYFERHNSDKPWVARYSNKLIGSFATEDEAIRARAEYFEKHALDSNPAGHLARKLPPAKAIRLAGSVRALAASFPDPACNQSVYAWRKAGVIPAKRLFQLEKLFPEWFK